MVRHPGRRTPPGVQETGFWRRLWAAAGHLRSCARGTWRPRKLSSRVQRGARARRSPGSGASETLPQLRVSQLSWRGTVVGTPRTAHSQVTGGTSGGIRRPEVPTHPRAGTPAVPSASEQPAGTRTAWPASSELSQKVDAAGPAPSLEEAARPRGASGSKDPHFWERTRNCQSTREGAHRRRVMSADQLLPNKEGASEEKVAAAAAPQSLGGRGRRETSRGRRLRQPRQEEESKGL